jgi:hypothetical protein
MYIPAGEAIVKGAWAVIARQETFDLYARENLLLGVSRTSFAGTAARLL